MFGRGSGWMGAEGLLMLGGADNSPSTGATQGHRSGGRLHFCDLRGLPVAIKATLGLRVSNEEEEEGLDIGEHGEVAYVGSASSRSSGPITSIALGIVIAAAMTKLSQGRR